MKISDYSYFLFDCDGVILDSNSLKTEAFRITLSKEPELAVEKLIDYHRLNGGITRQKKFEYFFHEIKKIYDKNRVIEASNRFAEICSKGLLEVDLVPGIIDFLKTIESPAYVVTGGNEQEVKRVFEQRELDRYFCSILGNPASKDSNMSLLESRGCFNGKGLYFGDSKLDFDLATKYGLDFILISGYSEWEGGISFCQREEVLVGSDFTSIKSILVG